MENDEFGSRFSSMIHAVPFAVVKKKKRVMVSWSSGKDSAWTLHRLRADAHFAAVEKIIAYIFTGTV